ncbi:MAG: DUF1549 and DUF1553 domain-containing protein [Verrucomicrobiaceae bacterium]
MFRFIPAFAALSLLTSPVSAQKTAAKYWAYQPVQKVSIPKIEDPFVTNPIDAFILDGLRQKNLTPNPPANPQHLIRRVYYDTTGLPPSQAQLNDTAKPWPTLVDELLASPAFGEKFASHWLDLVRYAETNGFERDSDKPQIWRYRDYTVNAFNTDKPYDLFLREQIAGDELPNPTFDSQLATGFMTLMQRDDEPADRPQADADQVGDIVDVVGEAFMGSTLNCAKCHDHKGDPITQADYFSVMSFFDGIASDHFKNTNHTWTDPEAIRQHEQQKNDNLARLQTLWSTVDQSPLAPLLKKSPTEQAIFKLSDQTHRETWQHSFIIPENPGWSLPSFDASIFKETQAPFTRRKKDFNRDNSTNWRLEKKLVLRKEFGLPEIPSQFLIYAKGHLTRLRIQLNGTTVYDGTPPKTDATHFIPLPQSALEQLTTGRNVIGVIAETDQKDNLLFDLGAYTAPISDISPDALALTNPALITALYGAPFAEKMTALQQQRIKLSTPVKGIPYLGIRELAKIDDPKIHERGSVHGQGDPVPIDFPTYLPEVPEPTLDPTFYEKNRTHGRRLAFATWLTQPDHPLTARVWVNRLWQYTMGHGLVETANDFGVFGTGVSNQALLDYLSNELVASGWSTKHILRLILNSSTYRLSTAHRHDSFQIDPTNKLQWRHNTRRLSAEEIWDTYLILTKRLKLDMGGPPVRPRMPQAVLATSSKPRSVWPETKGPAAFRRALYIHAKRSIKLPLLAAFDSPERDISCPSRFATTVPTQALTMLNSEYLNELAHAFADRLDGTLEAQTQQAFQLATGRSPNTEEAAELQQLTQDLRTTHQVPEPELLPRLCLLILNLNETIHLD